MRTRLLSKIRTKKKLFFAGEFIRLADIQLRSRELIIDRFMILQQFYHGHKMTWVVLSDC